MKVLSIKYNPSMDYIWAAVLGYLAGLSHTTWLTILAIVVLSFRVVLRILVYILEKRENKEGENKDA